MRDVAHPCGVTKVPRALPVGLHIRARRSSWGVMNKPKVLVGMSGGVDSSVAAALLLEQGHNVTGVTMKLWAGDATAAVARRGACYGPGEAEDIARAGEVARALGIPFHVLDLSGPYQKDVLNYVRHEYGAGRTPNPCVRCNRLIKFGRLVEAARRARLDFGRFATGHYARVGRDEITGRWALLKGIDPAKDQSYFLSGLTQDQLALSLFPLGEMTKLQVREKARALGLKVHDRPESQDFIEGSAETLLGFRPHPGPILDLDGRALGEHKGISYYTIGQRKGLGLAAAEPLHVLSIDAERNALIVGPKSALLALGLVAGQVNWIAIEDLDAPRRADVRIRHRHREAPALLEPAEGRRVRVRFDEPQTSVTPGQAAVFYDGDAVLGGGIIESGPKGPKDSP